MAKGWIDLVTQATDAMIEAYDAIASDPRRHTSRQYRLKGEIGSRSVNGQPMEQWQHKPTGAGRIWYCVDDELHVAWVTLAGTGHPAVGQFVRGGAVCIRSYQLGDLDGIELVLGRDDSWFAWESEPAVGIPRNDRSLRWQSDRQPFYLGKWFFLMTPRDH